MVVKFNVKKDVLLGAVRKAAGSWIRTKEMALSVKSDGQGNYKVCVPVSYTHLTLPTNSLV